MSTVVVTDFTWERTDIERAVLEPLGCDIVECQCTTVAETIDACRGADQIVSQYSPITAEVIDHIQSAKMIVRYGIGYDNVDAEAAAAKKIPVCNVPDYCIDEVADTTLGLMLSALRQFGANHRYIQQGHWGMGVPLDRMFAMHTMTVGIVGCGRIGRAVAARLQPFNCRVVAFDPVVAEADIKAVGCEPVSLEEVWAMSDLITLHCPSNRYTENLVAAGAIEQMKQGVILVNCARGTIVNTHDLVAALESGKVGFAALDVVAPEPLPVDHPLRTMENVLINSHLAVSTVDCVERLRRNVAEIVACSVRGEPLPNIVNGVTPAVEG